jgi:ElaA protein
MLVYTTQHFTELSIEEVYRIIQLRLEVFCVEQQCPYQDCDSKDLSAYHVMGKNDKGIIMTYSRILADGVSFDGYSSIGRVVSDPSVRGSGEGKKLMQYSIQQTKLLYPNKPIQISAQSYLLQFYISLGFTAEGEEFLEDNIPHTHMKMD